MIWNKGIPPKDDKTYLLLFASGIISSGKYRHAHNFREPQSSLKAWRCDCCGNFATPVAWANYPEIKEN